MIRRKRNRSPAMPLRIFLAAGILATMAGSAAAQQAPVPAYGEKDKDKTLTQQQMEKDAERAYRRSLGNVPDKAAVDPWGSARSTEPPKAAAKGEAKHVTAKPKAKAGGAPD
jgi:hypothetical protein